MARSLDVIKQQIYDEIATKPELALLTSNTSAVAIFKLWVLIQAVCISLFEQINDVFRTEVEGLVAKAPPGTEYWTQQRVKEFQYDAINPQIVKLDTTTLAVAYDPVDTTKRIITRCSVKTTATRIVNVKVAKSEPPTALSAPELAALKSYLTAGGDGTFGGAAKGIGFAGVQYNVTSTASDKFWLQATIYYNGQYAGVIQANVIAAIKNYWANIPFDGSVKIIDLEQEIKKVTGVNDVFIQNAALRADGTAFANKTMLINSYTQIFASYQTFAGYITEETTAGEDLASKLTFTAST